MARLSCAESVIREENKFTIFVEPYWVNYVYMCTYRRFVEETDCNCRLVNNIRNINIVGELILYSGRGGGAGKSL